MPRFDVFKVSELRIDQQACGHGEGGALGLVGQAAEAEGTADPHLAVTTASLRSAADVAIAFSHGGETTETLRALEVARDAGALAVAVTSAADSPVALAADVVLLTHAHESPFRMAAMSSRIAQLALVDVLFVRVVQHRGEPVAVSLQRTHDAVPARRRS